MWTASILLDSCIIVVMQAGNFPNELNYPSRSSNHLYVGILRKFLLSCVEAHLSVTTNMAIIGVGGDFL